MIDLNIHEYQASREDKKLPTLFIMAFRPLGDLASLVAATQAGPFELIQQVAVEVDFVPLSHIEVTAW